MAVIEFKWYNELDMALDEMEEALKEYKAAIEKVKEAGAELAGELSGDALEEFAARQEQLDRWQRLLAGTAEHMIGSVRKNLEMDRKREMDILACNGEAVWLSMKQELKG